MRNKKSILVNCISLIVVAILVFADQFTKYLVVNNIPKNSYVGIIEPVLYFTHVYNEGAAFSMLSGKQIFFIVLTFIMLLAIFIIYMKTPKDDKKYIPFRYVLVFLMAGAIGNLIDRIRLHYVVDFIDSRLIYLLTGAITGKPYDFPIYNVADICVTLSMLALIILILLYYKDNDFAFLKSKKSNTFTETEVYVIKKDTKEKVHESDTKEE